MRLILNIQYDGTEFSGWQIQPNARTIQGELQKVLEEYGVSQLSTAAGRTDAGVHASNMTAHVPIDDSFPLPIEKAAQVISKHLPTGINISKASITDNDDFHARFSAKAREYSYYIHSKPDVFLDRYSTLYHYPMNWELLEKSAKIFKTQADFTTFSKVNPAVKNNICNIEKSQWLKIGENRYKFEVKSDRFLYGMVRSLVGTMFDVARGKRTIEDVQNALIAKDRNLNSTLAPAQGLFFEEASY